MKAGEAPHVAGLRVIARVKARVRVKVKATVKVKVKVGLRARVTADVDEARIASLSCA